MYTPSIYMYYMFIFVTKIHNFCAFKALTFKPNHTSIHYLWHWFTLNELLQSDIKALKTWINKHVTCKCTMPLSTTLLTNKHWVIMGAFNQAKELTLTSLVADKT